MSQQALLADERRLLILAKLKERSVVRVRELAEEFHTSQMTIRRDLITMDAEGLLRQVHGGAVPRYESMATPDPAPSPHLGHVGIIVPVADYYFSTMIGACKQTLQEVGMPSAALVSNYDVSRERAICEQFVDAGATALIYAPTFVQPSTTPEITSWLFDLPIPVVLLERDISDPKTGRALSSARTAYEKGWEMSLHHLRVLGHRRVALATHGRRQVGVNLETLWHQAAADAGFHSGEAPLIVDSRATLSPSADVLTELTRAIRQSRATAVISHCDQATLGIVHALRSSGLRIPGDISVITNEDQIAQMTDPPLTSNSPAKESLGRTVARMAHDLVKDPATPTQHVLIQPTLTHRDSTAPPCEQRSGGYPNVS